MSDDSRHRSALDRLPDRPGAIDAASVQLRVLEAHDDLAACVSLQLDTWGEASADIVPASLMQAVARVGGLVVGAFAEDGGLVGFVFGLSGFREDARVHWSHMLAVHRDARGSGIGRRLKEYQRMELARRGVERIFWTFDPLQARNAHLNFNRLGVRVVEYVPNMYGSSPSPLHYGLATDRLIVASETRPIPNERNGAGPAAPERVSLDATSALRTLAILTPFPAAGDLPVETSTAVASVLVEIPSDLEETFQRSPAAASEWRRATREHLQWAFARGLTITALLREPVSVRSFYLLTPTSPDAHERVGGRLAS